MAMNGEGIFFKNAMNGYKREEVNSFIIDMNNKLKNATETYNQERAALERKIESLKEANTDIAKQLEEKDMLTKSALAEYEVKYSAVCQEIEKAKEHTEELEEKLAELEAENERLKADIAQSPAESEIPHNNEADEAVIEELRARVASLEAELSQVNENSFPDFDVTEDAQTNTGNTELDEIRSVNASLEAEITLLNVKITSLEAELAESRINSDITYIADDSEQNEPFCTDDKANEESVSADDTGENGNDDITTALVAQISDLCGEKSALDAEAAELRARVSSLEDELDKALAKQAEAAVPTVVYQHPDDNELAGLRSDKTSLEADVVVLRAKVASLESELADTRTKAAAAVGTCDSETKEKARKYDELRDGVGEIILKANVISVELVENARMEAEKILSEANGRAEYVKSQLTKTATDITDFLRQLSSRAESTASFTSVVSTDTEKEKDD